MIKINHDQGLPRYKSDLIISSDLKKSQCNAKKSDVCIPNFRAHHQNTTRPDNKTKTSQIVNNNNPAQNFFSIAQFPTKKTTPFLFFL